MTVKPAKNRVKRSYRLYGVDCPETNGMSSAESADLRHRLIVPPAELWGHSRVSWQRAMDSLCTRSTMPDGGKIGKKNDRLQSFKQP
jgi:hypothetical protein